MICRVAATSQGGVLHDAYIVAVILQEVKHTLPSTAVDKAAVHENDGYR
jgi:hypothetical protein